MSQTISNNELWNPIRARELANTPWDQALKLKTEKPITLEKGTKNDHGKPPIYLVDPDFISGLAEVLGYGAREYGPHNWRGGISYSRLISAMYRHLGAINRGEDTDPDSGKPHAYHLGCCAMFLGWMMDNRKDLDDRWKKGYDAKSQVG